MRRASSGPYSRVISAAAAKIIYLAACTAASAPSRKYTVLSMAMAWSACLKWSESSAMTPTACAHGIFDATYDHPPLGGVRFGPEATSTRMCGRRGPECRGYFLIRPLHRRRHPRAVDDGLVGPIGTDIERERAVQRRQPVAFLVRAGRFGASIKRQRTIRGMLCRGFWRYFGDSTLGERGCN